MCQLSGKIIFKMKIALLNSNRQLHISNLKQGVFFSFVVFVFFFIRPKAKQQTDQSKPAAQHPMLVNRPGEIFSIGANGFWRTKHHFYHFNLWLHLLGHCLRSPYIMLFLYVLLSRKLLICLYRNFYVLFVI